MNGSVGFEMPSHKLSHSFTFSTDEAGCRVNSARKGDDTRPRIVVLGASTAFGYGVSDEETFCWLLGEALPQYRFENRSVAAYHIFQSLLDLEDILQKDTPRGVVLALSAGIDSRINNAVDGVIPLQYPYPAAVSTKRKLRRYPPELYKSLAFSQTVKLVAVAEYTLNRLRFRGRGAPRLAEKTVEHVLLMLRRRCEKQGVPFLIAVMGDCRAIYPMLIRGRFNWCIANRDESGYFFENVPKWHLFPFDNHPNRAGHAHMATVIAPALEKLLDGCFVAPDVEQLGPLDVSEEPQRIPLYPLY